MEFIEDRTLHDVACAFFTGQAITWPFYSHRETEAGHVFSNLYPCSVEIDTALRLAHSQETILAHPDGRVTFASTEHIFQCAKASERRDDFFCRELSTGAVARCGQGRLSLSGAQRRRYVELGGEVFSKGTGRKKRWYIAPERRYPRRPNWREIKVEVMWVALRAKFEAHPHLKEAAPAWAQPHRLLERPPPSPSPLQARPCLRPSP